MKRINPRRAKLHRSYSITELATALGVHKHTVRHWIRLGLPTVDGTRPILILGSDLQTWWKLQHKAAKRPCQPGQLYCCKCREPKAPALGMVEYAAINATTGNLKALCETCGSLMHLRTRLADVKARTPGLAVTRTLAPSSIVETAKPSPNCDNSKGA